MAKTNNKKNINENSLVFIQKPTHKTFNDKTGKTFNMLTILGYAGKLGKNRKRHYWWCKCLCGTIKKIVCESLRANGSKSCGCLVVEAMKEGRKNHGVSIGITKHSAYFIYLGIKQRCFNENFKYFDRYGGRGITMCEGWKNDPFQFCKDVGERPSKKYSIDRKNNDGHYSCGHCKECESKGWGMNCRWVTNKEQSNNRSSNRIIKWNNESKTLAQWSRKLNIPRTVIESRLGYLKWSVKKSLSTPVTKKAVYEYKGVSLTSGQWAKKIGINESTLLSRLSKGWSVKKALETPLKSKQSTNA